jgi:predicted RNase H-like nuclease (RuvC/YqgF family)
VHCASDLQPSAQRDLHFLDSQVESLSVRIKVLQHAFNESRDAMTAFREEMTRLRDVSRQENEILLENMRMHRYSVEMMREEVKQMKRINKPWWVRLRDAIWESKS